MGWFDRLFGLEKYDATPSVSAVGFPTNGGLIPYGVSPTTTLALSSVWGAVRIIRNGISQLEWTESRGTLDLPLSPLVDRPWAERTRREWTMQVVETLALFDVCHLLKVGEDSEGVPRSLIPIPPDMITPASIDPWSFMPPQEYMLGTGKVSADRLVILHTGLHPGIPDHLAGILTMARASLAATIAAENYASRYWQAGGSPVTQIKTDQALTETQATELGNRWAARRAQGPDHPAVLGMGAEAKPFGADVLDAAAVETRREMVADVARYFGIPTRLLNAPTGDTETYTASGDTNLDILRFTFQNYIDAICDGFSDLLPGRRRVGMRTKQLTQGSQLARYQAWQLATAGKGWMLPENVREEEQMAPLEDAQLAELNPPPVAPVNAEQPQAAASAQNKSPRNAP